MDRRKFLTYVSCGCGSLLFHSCTTAPITDRKQLKIIPEAKLNAQAAQIYEKVKKKEKMSDDTKTLNEIKEIGKRMEDSISEYFYRSNLDDPTKNFEWENWGEWSDCDFDGSVAGVVENQLLIIAEIVL